MFQVGTLVFGIISQLMLDNLGWRLTFVVDAAITLVVGASCGALFRPLPVLLSGKSDTEPLIQSQEAAEPNPRESSTIAEDGHSKSYGSFSNQVKEEQPDSLTSQQKGNDGKTYLKQNLSEQQLQGHLPQDTPKTGTTSNNENKNDTTDDAESAILESSQESSIQISQQKDVNTGCCGCSEGCNCLSIFQELVDVSLFKNPVFSLFAFSVLMFALGYHIPYTYTPERAIMLGVPANQASLLISVMGISNVGFRLLLGWVADRSATLRFFFGGAVLTFMGCLGLMISLFNTFPLLVLYSVLFGAFSGE